MTVVGALVGLAVAMALIGGRDSVLVVSGEPSRADADAGVALDDAARERTFTYAADVAPEIHRWVDSALARVHPGARRLIDAVDGQVTVHVHAPNGRAAGFVQPMQTGFVLSLDAATLAGHSPEIRDHVIAHELGHVVDIALVPPSLNAQLDLGVPRIGGCAGEYEDAGCAPAEERFADTFAKWALNDPVVLAGAQSVGYRVAPPANLALWGEPLLVLPV